MKKTSVLLFLFLGINLLSFGQKEDFSPPQITPPSPTAYELGKYGFGKTGMFTGTPNVNIPLYNYTSGKLAVPISLSYNSSGIKVDELSPNVGLGWSLNAGGVITRIIKGKSDEFNNMLYPRGDISEHGVRSPMALDFFYNAGQYSIDSEPDIYAYNFNGYSGKFVYTKENKLMLMPHKDFKIEPYVEGYLGGFKITTPDGIRYIFLEDEINMNRASGGGWYPPGLPDTTSWFLSKIVHPSGDIIEFVYEIENSSYVVSISESIKIPSSDYQDTGCSSSTNPGDYQIDSISNHLTIAGKRLIQIKSNHLIYGTIDFSYIYDHPNSKVTGDYKLVSTIEVNDKESVNKEKIDLEYLFTANERPFLKKVQFNDPAKKYEFEYIDPQDVPERLDYGQDHWGYNNGKNNVYKFPNPNLMGNYLIPGEFRKFNIGANREVDTAFAKKGMLKKVTYPTGGNTEFEYESNSYYGTKKVYPTSQSSYLEVNTDFNTAIDEQTITLTNIQSDQIVEFFKSIDFNDYETECGDIENYPSHHILATLYVINQSNTTESTIFNSSIMGEFPIGNSINITPDYVYPNAKIQLKAGNNYEIKLKIVKSCLRAAMSLTYFEGAIQEVDDNINIGGSRVKRITIFDPVKNKTEYKRYFYGSKDVLNISSGQMGITPFYVTNDEDAFTDFCGGGGIPSEYIVQYKLLNSSSVRTLYESSIGITSYEYVTVSHGGDNFENGGEEHKFIIGYDYPGNPLWGEYRQSVTWTNAGWDNGLEERSIIFKKDQSGSNFTTLKKIDNNFKEDERNYNEINSYAVNKKYERIGVERSLYYICTDKDVAGGSNSVHTYVNCRNDHKHKWVSNSSSMWSGGAFITNILFPQFSGDTRVCMNSTDQVLIDVKHKCFDENKQVSDSVTYSLDKIRNLDITEYKSISYWHYLDSTTVNQYDINGANPVTTATKYIYDNDQHLQLTRTQTNDSRGNIIENKMYYPEDIIDITTLPGSSISDDNLKAIDSLKFYHRINIPIQTDVTKNGTLFRKRLIYNDWIKKANSDEYIVEPDTILSSKGTESLEPRLVYHDYDSYGNPLEVSKTNGTHVVYIWGYDHTMPIAKIENAKQDDFITDQNTKIAAAITASDNDSSETLENTLRVKLEDLRLAFGNSQVTTYTYDPLIGVTSITDPSGYTSFYVYDDFNRLLYIKDKDGKVLKSYKYHYQGQVDPDPIVTYTVTDEIDGGVGSVSITPIDVESGSYSDITATPGSGYEIDYIKVGTTSYPFTNNTARIDNITSNTEVHVQFKTLTVALTANPTFLFFEDIDSDKTITVTSGGSWTVSKSDSWIIISTTTGSGNGTFTIRPLKNLGSLRTGTVTVSDGSTSITISIEQLGGGGPL